MEAQPNVGDTYNEELAKGVAEDKATVLRLERESLRAFRLFHTCTCTKEYYAP